LAEPDMCDVQSRDLRFGRGRMTMQPSISSGVALLAYVLEIFIIRRRHAADPNSIVAVRKRGFLGCHVRFALIVKYAKPVFDTHKHRFHF
jgi:hypothetical protein